MPRHLFVFFALAALFARFDGAVSMAAEPMSMTATTIDQVVHRGALKSLDTERAILDDAGKQSVLAISDVLTIERTVAAPTTDRASPLWAVAVDGSLFECGKFLADERNAVLTTTAGLTIQIPLRSMAGAAFRLKTRAAVEEFRKLALRRRNHDVLAVQRDGKDFDIEGVLGEVKEEKLVFVVDGDELPVQRDRVNMLLYAQKVKPKPADIRIQCVSGLEWRTDSVILKDGSFRFLAAGMDREAASGDVIALDYTSARVHYLSELDPTLVRHTPFFDVSWEYRRDQTFSGGPLRIGKRNFVKGLAVHSKSELEYELAGAYRRFEMFAGIDESSGPHGDALVRVSVDGKAVKEFRVRAGEPEYPIAIPVAGAQRLTLDVDFGDGFDLGDQVIFGQAQLIR